jgi:rfaE bifunctional protein nucleotidyltransferase chain/domain
MDPVVLENVSKAYRRYAYRRRFQSLKSVLLGRDRAIGASSSQVIQALDGVSFSVPAGGTVGIIGSNGSGKSTLLKLIAGISKPTGGTVTTRGRIAALIELGAGFHPEISGRENVFINGIMLGLSKQEINRRFEEIVSFAGLEEFIEAPVKTYSSGMYMRLGFSVAVHVDPEILLIDEILAVGDEAFSHKCVDRIRNFQRRGKTIVLVTHSLDMVEGLCDRAIWIDEGAVRDSGDPRRVIDAYLLDVAGKEDAELVERGGRVEQDAPAEEPEAEGEDAAEEDAGAGEPTEPERRRWGTREIEITAVTLLDGEGSERYVYRPGQTMTIRADLEVTLDGEKDIVFGVGIFDAGGVCCYGTNTDIEGLRTGEVQPGPHTVSFEIPSLDLVEGTYFLDLAVHRKDGYAFDYHRGLHSFRIRSRLKDVGIVRLAHNWSFSEGIAVTTAHSDGEPAGPETPETRGDIAEYLDRARAEGRRVVFTNGCFDLLHSGHIRVLQRARAEGDLLVVGLNSDDSVRRLKGSKRPILPQDERAAILSALECVDRVLLFEEDTPLELIRRVRPDVLVKGGDWTPEQIVGREDVEAAGGRVVVIPLLAGRATTAIIETIRERYS